jgi:hypothetical protein
MLSTRCFAIIFGSEIVSVRLATAESEFFAPFRTQVEEPAWECTATRARFQRMEARIWKFHDISS